MGEAPEVRGFFVGAGLQLGRHRVRRRRRTGAGRVGRRGRADQRPGRRRHPPVRAVPRQPRGGCATGSWRSSACTTPCRGRTASSRAPGRCGCSPLHDRLAATQRLLRLARWAGSGRTSSRRPERSRSSTTRGASRSWLPWSAAEQRATRSAVAVFDQTSFSKYLVTGRDAEASLQWICTNDVAVPVGAMVYTGLLNRRGTYESDLTVTRVADDRFLLVSSVRDHRARPGLDPPHRPAPGTTPVVVDVTAAYAVLGVMGPRSRDLLARRQRGAASTASVRARRGWSGSAAPTVRATRITYVGELGWELYVPTETRGRRVRRPDGGRRGPRGRDAGYYAIESLRLEKGYRAFGRELTPDYRPVEAGLLFACKLRTDVDFLGRAAVEEARAAGPRRRLVSFVVDDPGADAVGRRAGAPRRGAGRPGHQRGVGRDGRRLRRAGVRRRPGRRDLAGLGRRPGSYAVNVGGSVHPVTVGLRRAVRPGQRADPRLTRMGQPAKPACTWSWWVRSLNHCGAGPEQVRDRRRCRSPRRRARACSRPRAAGRARVDDRLPVDRARCRRPGPGVVAEPGRCRRRGAGGRTGRRSRRSGASVETASMLRARSGAPVPDSTSARAAGRQADAVAGEDRPLRAAQGGGAAARARGVHRRDAPAGGAPGQAHVVRAPARRTTRPSRRRQDRQTTSTLAVSVSRPPYCASMTWTARVRTGPAPLDLADGGGLGGGDELRGARLPPRDGRQRRGRRGRALADARSTGSGWTGRGATGGDSAGRRRCTRSARHPPRGAGSRDGRRTGHGIQSAPGVARVADVPDLRPLRDTDVADVLTLNERNVVKLAPMDEARLHELRETRRPVRRARRGRRVRGLRDHVRARDGVRLGELPLVRRAARHAASTTSTGSCCTRTSGGAGSAASSTTRSSRSRRRTAGSRSRSTWCPATTRRWRSTTAAATVEVGRLGDDEHLVSLMEKPL